MKVLLVDQRKWESGSEHDPVLVNGAAVKMIDSFRFFAIHVTSNLTLSLHTDAVTMKAH